MTAPATYLDYNATAPLRPEAAGIMTALLSETGNPSSVHGPGRQARRRIEDAREQVAALVAAVPADLLFTAGATEANNLALRASAGRVTAVSAIEHDSVRAAAAGAAVLPVDGEGRLDRDALETWMASVSSPAFLSLMLANNETGVIQPVAEIAARARAVLSDVLIHCDAVQAAGRLPVCIDALGVDYLTLSSHKLGGPQGVGALVVAAGAPLAADRVGGGQERGRRAGTEPVAAIAGFGAAASAAASEGWSDTAARRDRMERALLAVADDVRIVGARAPRLPNTSCIVLPGVASETQVMALDLAGIAVSAGAACSSGKVSASHVLRAMGMPDDLSASAIRVSLGPGTDDAEIGRFVAAWSTLAKNRRVAA